MLSAHDPRARGSSRSRDRSRSRGAADPRDDQPRTHTRDRSRDMRAPSPGPARAPPAPSPARVPEPSHETRSTRGSGRRKKYYESESESEVLSESEEQEREDERRVARRRRDDEYEYGHEYDPRSMRDARNVSEVDYYDTDRRYERERGGRDRDEGREGNRRNHRDSLRGYDAPRESPPAAAGGYNYAPASDYTSRMHYVKPPPEDLAYGEHYVHEERKRHPGMNAPGAFPGAFPMDDDDHEQNVGRGYSAQHQQQLHNPPMSPGSDRPAYMMAGAPGSRPQYQVPQQFQYAQPDPRLTYLPKNQGSQYRATPDAQIDIASSRKTRKEEEEEQRNRLSRQAYYDSKEIEKGSRKKKTRDVDIEEDRRRAKYRDVEEEEKVRRKKYRDDSDGEDKMKKKYRDAEDETRSKKYRDDSEDDRKKSKKYRAESDDDRKKKKKSRDASDEDKRSKKYRDDSDEDKRSKKYRDDSDDGSKKKKKNKSQSRSDSEDDDTRHRPRRDTDEKTRAIKHDPRMVEIHPGNANLGTPALNKRMHRLSVSGQGPSTALSLMAPHGGYSHGHAAGALPPGSPLLEAYHGTYQSISPMPSPLALPSSMDDGMSDLEPLDGDLDGQMVVPRSILKKRVEIYDPEPDALAIAAELKHTKPGGEPLVHVLPSLSDDNILALRTEYKKHFKVNGKGINIAKHIKLKVTGNLGKAAYATALGRWESEAYWSNFWYQSNTSRRELLIESLIGRSNPEIRKIKEAFSDKRYNDSLEKCMQAELKKDKFRHAVLLALEEKRQDELEKPSRPRIEADARDLYKALVAKDGGETAMIDIIVVRSDSHLRQVLVEFEQRYKANFARQMIAKSQNLVGETLAHILNGVLNRPVRDALLLHQAITETAKDRAELLVSRLVRAHWEPRHLERVKTEYRRKYGSRLESDVAEGTKGEFRDFCVALCGGAVR